MYDTNSHDAQNVIVIMEDSFRKDHLGSYGNKWIRTPFIDKLAMESIVFEFAYAEGLPTIPVRTSMFTGRYTLPFRGWQPLEQLDLLLAEILWDKQIATAIISDTYHMHKPQFSFCRGFDHVEWIRGQENDPRIIELDSKINLKDYSEKNWNPSYIGQPSSIVKRQFQQYLKNRAYWRREEDHHIAQVMESSVKWIERQVSSARVKSFCLVVDSFDPHEPWDPPHEYLDMYPVPGYDGLPIIWGGGEVEGWSLEEIRHLRAQYAATVTLSDKWTGFFLEKIEDLGLFDNTMIIFLSDHGEPLGEHGIIKKVKPWPYDELSHIPFIVRTPDRMGLVPKRLHSFVGVQDLAPTILDFFKIRIPPVMQGKSLIPVMRGESEGEEFGISGFHDRSWSIRNREWSYYLWLGKKMVGAKRIPELYKYQPYYVPPEPSKYELKRDQQEKDNLTAEEKELAETMDLKTREFIENLSPSPGDLMAKDFMKRQMTLRISS